jgi:hypothetical protein
MITLARFRDVVIDADRHPRLPLAGNVRTEDRTQSAVVGAAVARKTSAGVHDRMVIG